MLPEHPEYHHRITGEESMRRLKLSCNHCYLTRYSKNQACYILSVYEHLKPLDPVKEHFRIIIDDDRKLSIEGKDIQFNTIRELLANYEDNPIDPSLRSIGRAYREEDYRQRSRCTIL